ncbi:MULTISPECIES: hypothetical protein [unclassified Mycoplasma]|uniref:hypothetical protein n=1 Tax=unclassified Mycoplasma TaxID=2683645 RepID=UPI00197B3C0A|nr:MULTISPECIES: hypothetical protein [unclassified Mycoplasma]MBN4084116.1 hypothetical protein [Mycoplasma sp. CSL10166]MBU4693186.1 hypothetical protein [Mycoplasma sp. CSL7491-lung]MCU4706558.1 hypothetical protein [Mycoplasma sp. CSL7503-lung]
MKKKYKIKKIPFKTKVRWLFLGKYPLERKYKPKILEYLFLIFSSIVLLILQIIFALYLINLAKEVEKDRYLVSLILEIKKYTTRILISIYFTSYLVALILSVHVFYILRKTEFNKWIAIIGVVSLLLMLTPISILFLIVAYNKNELAFE